MYKIQLYEYVVSMYYEIKGFKIFQTDNINYERNE